MKRLAFITSEEDPILIQDDQLAIEPLQKNGYQVKPLVWDHSAEKMEQFDALIFRSCWNYHQKFETFVNWLQKVKDSQIPVFNPIDISKWNLNKKYLLELAQKGVLIPKTLWFTKGTSFKSADVSSKLENLTGDQIVIRPATSLSGYDTYLVSRSDNEKIEKIWQSMPSDRDIIVQEYIPEITTEGETSLMFFNGEFSHAIRKTPAPNEFRIHAEHGGKRFAVKPSLELISEAKEILAAIENPLLFARVDVIHRPQGAVLIELEIIDPMLFLGYSEGAPERFARAIVDKLRS